MNKKQVALLGSMAAALLLAGKAVAADAFAPNLKIVQIRLLSETKVYVRTSPQPDLTCSLWGEYVRVDASDGHGKDVLRALITAYTEHTLVDLWFTPSTAPGSNQNTGCDDTTIAVLTQLRMK